MSGHDRPAGSVESLYPFLYAGTSDTAAVLDQVRASTVAKIAEIAELRQTVAKRDADRLAECAAALAPHVDWPVAAVLAGTDEGLLDRVDVLGGSLRIDSPAGAGTRVVAELPCRS